MTAILLIEDEPALRRLLRTTLGAQGWGVAEAGTCAEGRIAAVSRNPDLIVLDLGLPDGDGLDLLAELRRWYRLPILILSARGREDDTVRGLDLGADDYLAKPFSTPELLARCRAALRRLPHLGTVAAPVPCGDLALDAANRRITRRGEELRLTPSEYRILAHLIVHAGQLVTYRQLSAAVWGETGAVNHSAPLRVHLHGLRRKIEEDPDDPRRLRTEVGLGYRLLER